MHLLGDSKEIKLLWRERSPLSIYLSANSNLVSKSTKQRTGIRLWRMAHASLGSQDVVDPLNAMETFEWTVREVPPILVRVTFSILFGEVQPGRPNIPMQTPGVSSDML